MKKQHQIHEFDPNIYPRKVWITCGVPFSIIKDMFELPDGIIEIEEDTDARVIMCRRLKPEIKGGVLIEFKNKSAMTIANITHESIHAAIDIFSYVDAYIQANNQEPFAYLSGWIADCCNQVKIGKFK